MSAEIAEIVERVKAHAAEGASDQAWQAAAALLPLQEEDLDAVGALLGIVERQLLAREDAAEALEAVFAAHEDRPDVVAAVGNVLETVHDIDDLNGAPAVAPVFVEVAERLKVLAPRTKGPIQFTVLGGLATVGRVLGRTWDDVVERALKTRVAAHDDDWALHYDYGLFLKTRGRFAEGQAANQRAFDLGGHDNDSVRWNLGICATGAGDGVKALEMWRSIDQKVELAGSGLPEGSYPAMKVRLAQRPLAERTRAEAQVPGEEETVWLERLSPCHGIIRSVLYKEALGVDYGDVILFDGAPITFHKYGDGKVAVFPHLATLARNGYRRYGFAGTQTEAQQLANLSTDLPRDAVVYAHSEQYVTLCRGCWMNPEVDHAAHDPKMHHIVRGIVCAPPDLSAAELLEHLDCAAAKAEGAAIFVPELRRAAGDASGAQADANRVAMLDAN